MWGKTGWNRGNGTRAADRRTTCFMRELPCVPDILCGKPSCDICNKTPCRKPSCYFCRRSLLGSCEICKKPLSSYGKPPVFNDQPRSCDQCAKSSWEKSWKPPCGYCGKPSCHFCRKPLLDYCGNSSCEFCKKPPCCGCGKSVCNSTLLPYCCQNSKSSSVTGKKSLFDSLFKKQTSIASCETCGRLCELNSCEKTSCDVYKKPPCGGLCRRKSWNVSKKPCFKQSLRGKRFCPIKNTLYNEYITSEKKPPGNMSSKKPSEILREPPCSYINEKPSFGTCRKQSSAHCSSEKLSCDICHNKFCGISELYPCEKPPCDTCSLPPINKDAISGKKSYDISEKACCKLDACSKPSCPIKQAHWNQDVICESPPCGYCGKLSCDFCSEVSCDRRYLYKKLSCDHRYLYKEPVRPCDFCGRPACEKNDKSCGTSLPYKRSPQPSLAEQLYCRLFKSCQDPFVYQLFKSMLLCALGLKIYQEAAARLAPKRRCCIARPPRRRAVQSS